MPAIWRSENRAKVASIAALALLGAVSPAAFGSSDGSGGPPNFMMTWDATGDSVGAFTYDPGTYGTAEWGTYDLGGPAGNRTRTGWRYQGELSGGNDSWSLSWDCVANNDPFVDATINVVNTSNTTQTFWVFMPLAIVPIGGGTSMSGSVSAVISDQNFDGGALGAGVNPVYQAYIDGNLVNTLWNPGYTLNAPFAGAANDTSSFGSTAGPAALATIGVRLEFTLSAGDSASVTGIFDIQPVPAPAGLALLGFAGLMGRRRRR